MRIGAVILAAGFGTRLAPLTTTTPKPLLEVGGSPVASHLVQRLQQVGGLSAVTVVVNDNHLDQWTRWQVSLTVDFTVSIVSNGVTTEAERLGAVADLSLAVTHLGDVDWVVVLAGDNLLDESLSEHVDAAVKVDQPVVLCRDLGTDVPPGRFGEVTTDNDGTITRFREKPAVPQSPLAATCSYVLPGDVGAALERYLADGDPDSPGGFVAWLAAQRPVAARVLTGRYFDIGNHETLAAARAAYPRAAY